MREHNQLSAKDIRNARLEYALKRDDRLRQIGQEDRIDDKTVFYHQAKLRNAVTDVFDSLRWRPFSRGWNLLRKGLK